MTTKNCLCCYCDNSSIKLTDEDVEHIKDIVGDYREFLNDQTVPTNVICVACHDKLTDFVDFKLKIIKTHQKFLQNPLIKSEPTEDPEEFNVDFISTKGIKQELERDEEQPNYPIEPITVINEHVKRIKKVPQSITTKLRTSSKRKRKRKDTPSEKDHYCPVCSKYFTEARKVKEHVKRIHLRTKNYHCDMCDYSAYKKYDIYLHITNIHKPKNLLEKNSICPTCGLAFLSNSRLNVHIRRKHQKSTMRRIACDLCPHRVATLNEMRCHMNVHLTKELRMQYSCEFCDAVFYSKGSLKTHRDVKHLFSNVNITCFCGKTFKQKSVYQRHYTVIHMGQKKFKCDECNKGFSGKTHLEYHKKAAHSDIVPSIPCEICGTLYKSLETLKRHFIYHGDPKFKCDECGKMFHENKKLMDHQSAHKILEFPCQYCQRSFRLETQLNYHLKKVHFKEKLTFKCELCSSTFTRKSTYRDHALRQHKELNQDMMTEFLKRIRKSLAEEHKT
ncbi:hypothetical protein ACKWTF_006248 [Chironomus riparius]